MCTKSKVRVVRAPCSGYLARITIRRRWTFTPLQWYGSLSVLTTQRGYERKCLSLHIIKQSHFPHMCVWNEFILRCSIKNTRRILLRSFLYIEWFMKRLFMCNKMLLKNNFYVEVQYLALLFWLGYLPSCNCKQRLS